MGKGAALKARDIEAINLALVKDQRVEVIPTKDGVRVFAVTRKELKAAGADADVERQRR